MARRRRVSAGTGEGTEVPRLTVPRAQVDRELGERIQLGQELLGHEIHDQETLNAAESEYSTWNDYNKQLLRIRFSSSEVSDEYARGPGIGFIPLGPVPLSEDIEDLRRKIERKLNRLSSIRGRLPLFDEPVDPADLL